MPFHFGDVMFMPFILGYVMFMPFHLGYAIFMPFHLSYVIVMPFHLGYIIFRLFVLDENEQLVFAKFMKAHKCYDLIPTSSKLVVFDTQLSVSSSTGTL